MDHLERTEEFIEKLPKEIADEIRKDAEHQENDKNFQRSDISTERLCDYIVLDYFPEPVLRYDLFPEFSSKFQLWSELQDRILATSFDEIMSLCEFIGSRRKLLEKYQFIASVFLAWLTIRTDKSEILKRLDESGGFELLGEQNKRKKFVQLSQKF